MSRLVQFKRSLKVMQGLALLFALDTSASAVQAQEFKSQGNAQLIELYTSEGCGSCPRADQWLSALEDDNKLWNTIFPVTFHVDYWDSLGWTDPYARAEFSARQRQHTAQGNLSQVYTPGFVINGQEWRGFFSPIKITPSTGTAKAQLNVRNKNGAVTISYTESQPVKSFNIAILGSGAEHPIRAGENAGRTLKHDFVVIGWQQVKPTYKNGVYSWQGNTPNSLQRVKDFKRQALVVWAVNSKEQPLQIAGGWLNSKD